MPGGGDRIHSIFTRKGPETVLLSLTDACNLSCGYCWRMDKPEGTSFSKGMDLETIIEVLDDCKLLGVRTIDFTGGGEPFLRTDLLEILGEAKSRGLRCGFTTNGTLFNAYRAQALIELGLDQLLFSIDSYDPGPTNRVRGSKVHESVLRSVHLLRGLQARTSRERPHLMFSSVVNKLTLTEIPGLVRLAKDEGIAHVTFTPIQEWESNRHLGLREFSREELDRAIDEGLAAAERYGVSTNLRSLRKHGVFEHRPPRFCYAPWDMAFVNADGQVMVCCTLATYHENVIGDVHTERFAAIWTGSKIRAFRDRMKEGRFHEKCRFCLPEFTESYNKRHEGERAIVV